MLLSAKLITSYANINNFDFADQWVIRSGEPNTLYFQIIDLDKAKLRHLLGIGGSNQPYSISVKFPSINDSKVLQIAAAQVDANDSSVWAVTMSASQTPFSGNVIFTIVEGAITRNFSIMNGIAVQQPGSDGSC